MKLSCAVSILAALSGLHTSLGGHDAQQERVHGSRILSAEQFNPDCKGPVLKSGKALRSNQYICAKENNNEYFFGLSSSGELHEVQIRNGNMKEYWTSEERGDIVRMQRDGNIVLRDKNDKVIWASNCYGTGAELTFHHLYPGTGATMRDPDSGPDYRYIWSVDSWEEYGSCHPPIKCKGHTLKPGQALGRDEYLCVGPQDEEESDWDYSYIFGLGNNGKLALLHHRDETVWTPAKKTGGAVELTMQGGGNLVLRNKNGDPTWVSRPNCKSEGNTVKMTTQGVQMIDKNDKTSWLLNYDGEDVGCFPDDIPEDQCAEVSTKQGHKKCRYRMIDHLNIHYTTLQVEEIGTNEYAVIDNFKSSCSEKWKIHVDKLETGALIIDAGVPEVTCKELMDESKMHDDSQLEFIPDKREKGDENHPCTDFAKNLIYFMINQWFYFG